MKPTEDKIFIRLILIGSVLLVLAWFGSMNSLSLRGEEPRRGVVSLEMEHNQNMWVPKLFGRNYYNKPPVYNWLIILGSKINGGFDNWVVRWPSLISLLLLVLLNYFLVNRFVGFEAAKLTTLLLIINTELLFYGGVYTGEIDLFYSLVVFLQLTAIFYFGSQDKYLLMFRASYFLCAVGLLTKGIPSLAFQFFGLLAFALTFKKLKFLFSWKHLVGIFLFILCVGAYFWMYAKYEDPWPYLQNLFLESTEKTAQGKSFLRIIRATLSFPVDVIRVLLPASVFLVFIPKSPLRDLYKNNAFIRFVIWVIVLNIPIYWITPSIKMRYIYMFFPFFTLLLVLIYLNGKDKLPRINKALEWIFFGVIVLSSSVYIYGFFHQFQSPYNAHKILLILFLAGTLALGIAWFRIKKYRLYLFGLSFLLLRIFMNTFYFPDFHEKFDRNKDFLETTLELTGDEPVYFAGTDTTTIVSNTLLNRLSKSDTILIPEIKIIHTELAFYYALEKKFPMTFVEEPDTGNYYISRNTYVRSYEINKLATSEDCLGECKHYVLYTLKPEENEIVP